MVKCTKDYSMFKLAEENRPVDEKNVKHIINCLSKKNGLADLPILVDQEMYILDGQHRLEACKRLKIEVYYKKCNILNRDDIAMLNDVPKWSIDDYVRRYAILGNEAYIKLKEILDTFNIYTNTFIRCVKDTKVTDTSGGGGGEIVKYIKQGLYKHKSSYTEKFYETLQRATILQPLAKTGKWHETAIIKAVHILNKTKGFSWGVMLEKLDKRIISIEERQYRDTNALLSRISDIYNKGLKEKIYIG